MVWHHSGRDYTELGIALFLKWHTLEVIGLPSPKPGWAEGDGTRLWRCACWKQFGQMNSADAHCRSQAHWKARKNFGAGPEG